MNPAPRKPPRDWAAWAIWLVVALLVAAGALVISQRRPPTVVVWQATRALPSYHLITMGDVALITVNLSSVPSGALPPQAATVGQYSRQPLAAQAILRAGDLAASADPTLITKTVPVSFPASAGMAYNGQLAPGAVVALWSVGSADAAPAISAKPLLDRVLVLDVERVNPAPTGGQTAGDSFVIVLAVPDSRKADVLAAAGGGKLSLTLLP